MTIWVPMPSRENSSCSSAPFSCGILELISPLEQQGILVRRSREQLEMEIDKFTIIPRRICSALSMTIWVPMPSRENSSCSSAPFS
jgi:hypothetical protein